MSTTARRDPLPVFCFKVQLTIGDKTADAFFKSVSGLRSETEIVPVRVGGLNGTTRQLVGATKWANLVLKKGFTGSSLLADWRQEWATGTKFTRVTGTIIQLDASLKQDGPTWTFTRGWPCKWEVSEFDASKSELTIETLEIAHEGLTFTGKSGW